MVKCSTWFQSTHSLRSATHRIDRPSEWDGFQSTHSLRSATWGTGGICPWPPCFNPRTPCGVRQRGRVSSPRRWSFNPRTPCGVRLHSLMAGSSTKQFQSTHSLRSATVFQVVFSVGPLVSIHALLAECDRYVPIPFLGWMRFQSTHSLRSATGLLLGDQLRGVFQSTHSLRSATLSMLESAEQKPVSIHALLAECDSPDRQPYPENQRFNPRTPCGVRLRPTLYIATQQSKSYFAPTSLKRPSLHGCSF